MNLRKLEINPCQKFAFVQKNWPTSNQACANFNAKRCLCQHHVGRHKGPTWERGLPQKGNTWKRGLYDVCCRLKWRWRRCVWRGPNWRWHRPLLALAYFDVGLIDVDVGLFDVDAGLFWRRPNWRWPIWRRPLLTFGVGLFDVGLSLT